MHNILWKFYCISVLVCTGCYGELTQAKVFKNNRNLFLTVMETGSSRLECQCGGALVVTIFRAADWQLFTLSSCGRRVRKPSEVSLVRILVPFMRAQPDAKSQLIWKDPDAGKDWRQEEKGMPEDEMVGWHYRFSGHDFE